VVTVMAVWATVTGVAVARSTDVCKTVAPNAAAVKKALGAGSFAPISYPGPPAYCGVGGAGATSARIYLYPKGSATSAVAGLGLMFGQRAPKKQSLTGLGRGATLEYVPGDTVVAYFTAGPHFILITGSGARNAQVVALAHAVHAKLG